MERCVVGGRPGSTAASRRLRIFTSHHFGIVRQQKKTTEGSRKPKLERYAMTDISAAGTGREVTRNTTTQPHCLEGNPDEGHIR